MAAILVIALFLAAMLHLEIVLLAALVFIVCLLLLIFSLAAFLQDINLSLVALKRELEPSDEAAN